MSLVNELIEMLDQKETRTPRLYCNELPPYNTLCEPTIVGNYSYYYMRSHWRHLKKSKCVEIGPILETPPAIARAYIQMVYHKAPRVSHEQSAFLKGIEREAPPQFARPGKFEMGYYVDIKSAYWSILKIVGWDIDYYPCKWIGRGRPPLDFPIEHKTARHCLVSCAISNSQSVYYPWPDDEIKQRNRGNGIANQGLWRLVLDVLHSIAAEAIDAGVVYVNTDGFIAPNSRVKEKVEGIISSWGLESSVKGKGPGEIVGSGDYAVGKMVSGHMKERREPISIYTVVEPEYRHWLFERFTHFAG